MKPQTLRRKHMSIYAIAIILPAHWEAALTRGNEAALDEENTTAFNAWITKFQDDHGLIFVAETFSDEMQWVEDHAARSHGVDACMCHQYAIVTEHIMEDVA
jgi:hypothetical protein